MDLFRKIVTARSLLQTLLPPLHQSSTASRSPELLLKIFNHQHHYHTTQKSPQCRRLLSSTSRKTPAYCTITNSYKLNKRLFQFKLSNRAFSSTTPTNKIIDYSKYLSNSTQIVKESSHQSSLFPQLASVIPLNQPPKPQDNTSKFLSFLKKTGKIGIYTFLWGIALVSGSYYLYSWLSPHPGYFSLHFLDFLREIRIIFQGSQDINTFNSSSTADSSYELEYFPDNLTASIKSAQRWILKENFVMQQSIGYILLEARRLTNWVDAYSSALDTLFQYICVHELYAQRKVLHNTLSLYQMQLRELDLQWIKIQPLDTSSSILDPSFMQTHSSTINLTYNQPFPSPSYTPEHHQPLNLTDVVLAADQIVHDQQQLDPLYLKDQVIQYLIPYLFAMRLANFEKYPITDLPKLISLGPSPSQSILQFDTETEKRRVSDFELLQMTKKSIPKQLYLKQLEKYQDLISLDTLHNIVRIQQQLSRLSDEHRSMFDQRIQLLVMIQALSKKYDTTIQNRLSLNSLVSELIQFNPTNPKNIDFATDNPEEMLIHPSSTPSELNTHNIHNTSVPSQSSFPVNKKKKSKSQFDSSDITSANLLDSFQLPRDYENELQLYLINTHPLLFAQDNDIEVSAHIQYQRDEAQHLQSLQDELRQQIGLGKYSESNDDDDIEKQQDSRQKRYNYLLGDNENIQTNIHDSNNENTGPKFDSSYSHPTTPAPHYEKLQEELQKNLQYSDGQVPNDTPMKETIDVMNVNNPTNKLQKSDPLESITLRRELPTNLENGFIEDHGTFTYLRPHSAKQVTLNSLLSSNNSMQDAPFTFQFFSRHALTLYQLHYALRSFRDQLTQFSEIGQVLISKVVSTESQTNFYIDDLLDIELHQDTSKLRQYEALFVELNKSCLDYSCARLNMHQMLNAFNTDMLEFVSWFHLTYPLVKIVSLLEEHHTVSSNEDTDTFDLNKNDTLFTIPQNSLVHILQYQHPPPSLTLEQSPERLFIFPKLVSSNDSSLESSSQSHSSFHNKYQTEMEYKIVDPTKVHSFLSQEVSDYYQYTQLPIISYPISADLSQTIQDIITFSNSIKSIKHHNTTSVNSPFQTTTRPLIVQGSSELIEQGKQGTTLSPSEQRILSQFQAKQIGIDLNALQNPENSKSKQLDNAHGIVDLSREGQKGRLKGYVAPLYDDIRILAKIHQENNENSSTSTMPAESQNKDIFHRVSGSPSMVSVPINDNIDIFGLKSKEIDELDIFQRFDKRYGTHNRHFTPPSQHNATRLAHEIKTPDSPTYTFAIQVPMGEFIPSQNTKQ